MEAVDYNKYENYIRVGNSPQTLQDFPTPSSLGITLHSCPSKCQPSFHPTNTH